MSKLHFLETVDIQAIGGRQVIIDNPSLYKRIILKWDIPTGQSAVSSYLNFGTVSGCYFSYATSLLLIEVEIGDNVAIFHTLARAQHDYWWNLSSSFSSFFTGDVDQSLIFAPNATPSVASQIDIYVE